MADSESADGAIWHLPAQPPATGRELAGLIGDTLGHHVNIKATGAIGFAAASLFVPVLRELRETRYQWQAPFVCDASRFQDTFGPFDATPLPDAVATTVNWWRTHHNRTQPGA